MLVLWEHKSHFGKVNWGDVMKSCGCVGWKTECDAFLVELVLSVGGSRCGVCGRGVWRPGQGSNAPPYILITYEPTIASPYCYFHMKAEPGLLTVLGQIANLTLRVVLASIHNNQSAYLFSWERSSLWRFSLTNEQTISFIIKANFVNRSGEHLI